MTRSARRRRLAVAMIVVACLIPAAARAQATAPAAAAPDQIARIFSGEFATRFPRPPAWFGSGATYVTIEPTATPGGKGMDVVEHDTATGRRREVLITAAQLTPTGRSEPLDIEDLSWSADNARVLVFTNTRRVWRTNSRGDYWLLDRRSRQPEEARRRGAGSEPDVRAVQPRRDAASPTCCRTTSTSRTPSSGAITRLTRDGSDLVINGGSDWVNEEELDLHDCFRWSPDGRRIAFWQFDLHGVGNFSLQYYLGQGAGDRHAHSVSAGTGPYPVTMNVPYPLAGTTNSAVRAGVVDARRRRR